MWGDCENWEVIEGDNEWIKDKNEIRNNIAHGLIPVEVQYVEEIISKIDDVKRVAKKFIIEWGEKQLHTSIQIFENE